MLEQVILNTNSKWWLPYPNLIQPYRKLAATLEQLKKLDEALIYLKRVLVICETIKEPPVVTDEVRKDLLRVSKLASVRHFILETAANNKKQ